MSQITSGADGLEEEGESTGTGRDCSQGEAGKSRAELSSAFALLGSVPVTRDLLGQEHSASSQRLLLPPVLAQAPNLYPSDTIGKFLTHPGQQHCQLPELPIGLPPKFRQIMGALLTPSTLGHQGGFTGRWKAACDPERLGASAFTKGTTSQVLPALGGSCCACWAAEAAWCLLEKSERPRSVGARISETWMDSEPWSEGPLLQASLLLWWPDGLSSNQIPACYYPSPPCPTVCVLSLRKHLQGLVLRREEQPWPQSNPQDPFAWEMGSTEPKKDILAGLMSPCSPVPDPIPLFLHTGTECFCPPHSGLVHCSWSEFLLFPVLGLGCSGGVNK